VLSSLPCPHLAPICLSPYLSLSLPLSLILSLPPFITLPHSPARALDKLKKQIQAAKEEKKRLKELKAAGIDPASVKKQEVTGTALNSPLLPALAPTSPVSSTSSYLALSSLRIWVLGDDDSDGEDFLTVKKVHEWASSNTPAPPSDSKVQRYCTVRTV
jgi:hypothetical protein